MKNMMLFKLEYCPFCKQARKYMDDVMREHPEYKNIPLEVIDEGQERARANRYDYYLVPTFYLDDDKVHEGAVTYERVSEIFREAYKQN